MVSTVEVQFLSLVISVFAGIAFSLLFDFYRTINYYIKPSKAFTHFMDLLFWIIAGAVVFMILLRAEFAELRVYTFIGMGAGIFIYFKLFSEYILKFYRWVIYILSKTIRILIIVVIIPFKLLYSLLWSPLNQIQKTLLKTSKSIFNNLKSVVKRKK